MRKVLSLFIGALLFSTPFSIPSIAQGLLEDYQRADDVSSLYRDKVWYGNVRPSWIGETSLFVYENETPDGREWILVNPDRGEKREAFDQRRFARSFRSVTGTRAEPGNLPITNVRFHTDPETFSFYYRGDRYTCSVTNYAIVKTDDGSRRAQQRGGRTRWPWGFGDELRNDPVESPDGEWTAFIKDYNLHIRSNGDNREYQLSYDGGKGEYYSSFIRWSPDSRKIVTARVRDVERRIIHYIESSPSEGFHPLLHSYEYPKPGDAIPQFYPQLFDIDTRSQIRVSGTTLPEQYSVGRYRWAADSRSITYEYNRRGHQQYQVIRLDAETGNQRVIINETSSTFIHYSGKRYRHDIENTNEIIWASERDGWNHLYLYNSVTGKVINQITAGEWIVRSVLHVDQEERRITFQAGGREPGDPYHIHVYSINFDGTGLTKLTDGDGTHEVFFSPDRRYMVDTWSRVDKPPVAVLRDGKTGELVMELERADITPLLETGWIMPEVFTAKGRDGETDIWGMIVRPSNFDEKIDYPVIEYIYAGPHSAHVPKRFSPIHSNLTALSELGFIVVQIDGMGTSHRSKAFHDVCWQNLGDAGFPDRIPWIREAAASYPYIDTTRVGVFGTSAGAQNAVGALLFHPGFYKVAVASCGCHDNRMDKIWWNEQFMGWPVGPHYSESSNVDNAWRLEGRLLLINGELDYNVDPASTTQLVDALIRAGKDFDYLFVPGMGHTSGGRYGERRRRDFFVRHLLGVEPPDWNRVDR